MNRTAFIWPIERVDAGGEPAADGEYLKIGLRRAGDIRTALLDLLDAEALAAGLMEMISRTEAPEPRGGMLCNQCGRCSLPGDMIYAPPTPSGGLLCETCAPTVAEEDSAIARALDARQVPPGFASRVEALTWRAKLRASHNPQLKRLERLQRSPAADLQFPEPPSTARQIEEASGDD